MGVILITGSQGLIGRYLGAVLEASGREVRRFDVARDPAEDVRDPSALARALQGVEGVIHLAAISRVARAQAAPVECEATNVTALGHLLRLCLERSTRPWVIFASSREVYGEPERLPVCEGAPLAPLNVYGRSKARGETLMARAAEAGLVANVCRLSNVYGCPLDHADRVVMAFAGAAARGGVMRVDGPRCCFDFTAVGNIASAIALLAQATAAGDRLAPVQFVSGRGTSLMDLALLARSFARAPVTIAEAPARAFDVGRFIGDPSAAAERLGWKATTPLEEGVKGLVAAMAASLAVTVASQGS
jgi:nucleoside-diphosphate-sugar epimerase